MEIGTGTDLDSDGEERTRRLLESCNKKEYIIYLLAG
jgi:hypothetical protein